MAARAEALADRFEQAVAEFVATVEGLSEAQWRAVCPNEQRTVGVLSHHVAAAIRFEMAVFREIAAGRQPSTLTDEQLAEMNAQDAVAWAEVPRDETLALLRRNAVAAAAEVRHLNEEHLARTGKYLAEMPALTVEQWLERMLIGHVDEHLESIRLAVAPGNARRPQ